ncbi:MAG: cyclopropane-fatty-acyl-phospholipid synthase family protein [Candidatus Accumulibacter sp. UW26]|jgi:cyclopropane-fatty-acyl-phospholipid synthase
MNGLDHTLALLPARTAGRRLPRSARVVLALLERIDHGSLELRLPDGSQQRLGQPGESAATLEIGAWSVFDSVIGRGDVGFAESWIAGDWHSPDLTALLTLLANNRQAISGAVYGQWWGLLAARLRHLLNANTRGGSRRNIRAHYDLGNDFYRLWLDPTMSYSSALYAGEMSLAAAQLAKYRRILQRLGARRGQRVLEIGCGWGAFAETAAREAGVEVVGLTLSPAQLQYARQRMQLAGVGKQVAIELLDYRDLAGEPFDHIVSIEMFEAVGERWWPTYFAHVARLLAPTGRAVIQSITIRDELFARYRRGTDFIQQHIFPGGMLPSPSVFGERATRAGLQVRDTFAFGRDYARTLAEWSANFEQHWPQIAALGFDEHFHRLWRFYLAYCQAGFNSGCTDVMQFELAHAQ